MKTTFNTLNPYRSMWATKTLLLLLLLTSCEDFLEIQPPNNQITGEKVFDDKGTINAALVNMYSQLRDNTITSGNITGLSYLLGLYSDELTLHGPNVDVRFFYENNLVASNGSVTTIWSGSYNIIYAANSFLEGVDRTSVITSEEKDLFKGEALLIRALVHFYLVNVFGDIPYIKTSDYRQNLKVSKLSLEAVYENIIQDLMLSKSLLPSNYSTAERTRPNKAVASALLSRVYIYNKQWELALDEALEIIANNTYVLNTDINEVFLNTSKETLWQFDTGISGFNTLDAQTYIFTSGPPPNSALSNAFLDNFEMGDARFTNWIGQVTNGSTSWYFPHKYKLQASSGATQECSIVFRLAELYLIAAEAHVHLNQMDEALVMLNAIRVRSNLDPLSLTDKTALLNSIYQEKAVEFFCEMAHRFLDLKRTDRANAMLGSVKPNWDENDRLFPIPESELIINPNLQPQNSGY